ncbi:MAG TPA: hypothetical protein VF765_00890 [Polyangiaceae bacterium]
MRALPATAAPSLLLLIAAACGGNAPPPQAPSGPQPAAQAAPPPPPDLSPVPEPQTLVVSGRLAKLSHSFDVAHNWSKLPMPQSEQVSEIMTTEAIGPIVDLDQPIDFAVAVVGSGSRMNEMTAVSAAVKDPDKVRASLAERYKLVPGDNGTTLIQGLGRAADKEDDSDDDDDDADGDQHKSGKGDGDDGADKRTCELAAAAGDAPVRIVCGWSAKALTELGPWLTRTAARAQSTTDLHADLRMGPLKPTIAEQRKVIGMILGSILGGRVGGSGMRDLMIALGSDAADFATDLDGATLDVTLSDPGALATFGLKLAGSSSTMGRLAVAHPERNGVPPATFWQMPADADLALFSRGIDDPYVARGRELVVGALHDVLTDAGVKDADAKAVGDAVGKLLSGAGGVYASGIDEAGVRSAIAAYKALGSDASDAKRADAKHTEIQELLGWRILEVEQPAAASTDAFKALVAALGRPSVAAAIRAKDKEAQPPVARTAPLPKGAALPAGTQHWVVELHSAPHHAEGKHDAKKPAAPAKATLVHFLVAPDGARSWVAIGGDDTDLAAKLAATLKSGSAGLTARQELASLKDAKVGSAGFLTARSLPEMATTLSVVFGGSGSGAAADMDEADRMPNKGATPIVFTVTPQPAGGAASLVATTLVPRGAVEDLVFAFVRSGGF